MQNTNNQKVASKDIINENNVVCVCALVGQLDAPFVAQLYDNENE